MSCPECVTLHEKWIMASNEDSNYMEFIIYHDMEEEFRAWLKNKNKKEGE